MNIELGRHKRPYVPPEERICDKCNLQLVEDELHCLMICPKWKETRVPLIKVAFEQTDTFTVMSVESQFQELLSSKSLAVNLALGQFLRVSLKINE